MICKDIPYSTTFLPFRNIPCKGSVCKSFLTEAIGNKNSSGSLIRLHCVIRYASKHTYIHLKCKLTDYFNCLLSLLFFIAYYQPLQSKPNAKGRCAMSSLLALINPDYMPWRDPNCMGASGSSCSL